MNSRSTLDTIDAANNDRNVEIADDASRILPDRYEDLRQLGSGGFGEVWRVFDHALGRVVAMKFLRIDRSGPSAVGRFLAEIKLAASLSHPGIVAIYDFGKLPNGRLWFTMPEVEGRTLRAVIDEAFAPCADESVARKRRLLDYFARICDAMAYAHSRGVIHRDLKPENIMVGPFGQVFVMDWGLARKIGDVHEEQQSGKTDPSEPTQTQHGDILGTPAYMAPEQAKGQIERHGPATDVYALGGVLYHLLLGHPYSRIRRKDDVLYDEPALETHGIATELASICARAMAQEPRDRYADASVLASEVHAFLAGARRRERALAELEKSFSLGPEIQTLRARADQLRHEASKLLSSVRPFDSIDKKLPGWSCEDEADALEQKVTRIETQWIQAVHGALAIDPDLPEGHAALADHYKNQLIEAERAQRAPDAARYDLLLRAHDRGQHAAILKGDGALSLVTDPLGARVFLYQWVMEQRRLVAKPLRHLGMTPLVKITLPKGSYLLVLEAAGYESVRYPVLIERGEHWDGKMPRSQQPHAIRLPRRGEVAEDEIYVPAGYAWTGGDPEAPDSLPWQRVWIDGFVIGRYPVTNEAYLSFLNDLVATGREAEALRACPKANPGTRSNAAETLSYARDADGIFRLKEDDPGEVWALQGPAVLMDWHAATAYTQWLSQKTQKPCRLLHELEREKATRGVDNRFFPWGNHFDPTFACMLSSHAGEPRRVPVGSYALDEGPYGLRDGSGNSRDFCINGWTHEGPAIEDERLVLDLANADDPGYRSVRGGAWSSVQNHCRAAARFVLRPNQRRSAIGLRIGRALF